MRKEPTKPPESTVKPEPPPAPPKRRQEPHACTALILRWLQEKTNNADAVIIYNENATFLCSCGKLWRLSDRGDWKSDCGEWISSDSIWPHLYPPFLVACANFTYGREDADNAPSRAPYVQDAPGACNRYPMGKG